MQDWELIFVLGPLFLLISIFTFFFKLKYS